MSLLDNAPEKPVNYVFASSYGTLYSCRLMYNFALKCAHVLGSVDVINNNSSLDVAPSSLLYKAL